jgi:aspartyl-tRNA(Asn)/glutamyl-tRNA(Gln) amidotransferase subunit C
MTLSPEDVDHIAELARLELTGAEREKMRDQLSAILDYAARLQQINTDNIPPTASVLSLHSVLREDEPGPALPREKLLSNTDDKEDGMFRVDVILE